MANKQTLLDEIAEQAERTGLSADVDGKTVAELAKMLEELKVAESATQDEQTQEESAPDDLPDFFVSPGKSITTKVGVLTAYQEVKEEHMYGKDKELREAAFAALLDRGVITASE